MRIPIYQIDAFTDRPFAGNPAAVMPLESWIPDGVMQSIARENNLAETAFLVEGPDGWHIRWFTPECEIDLCGHATLASAFVLFTERDATEGRVAFQSRSGRLEVYRDGDRLVLDFPSRPPEMVDDIEGLAAALRAEPSAFGRSRDMLAVFETEAEIRALKPDMAALAELKTLGIIVTARASTPGVDFVSRFFAPSPEVGVPEDPVTGSAHCTLIPYWGTRLGKSSLRALQVSRRGGELWCELEGDRVHIGGHAVKVMQGEFWL